MAQTTSSVINFEVKIRSSREGDVKVLMGATVISNPFSERGGNSILVLNGTSQTSQNFKTLAESVFADQLNVSRMVLLDYPGHGLSGFPVGVGENTKFGDLTMDDYVTVLLESLQASRSLLGRTPNIILAHSLGAELTQMLQHRLVSRGTNLRTEFGITNAIFIASDIPGPLGWAAIDAGAADPLAMFFVREDRDLGSVFDLLTLPQGPENWIGLFYRDLGGQIVAGAPTPDEAISRGLISFESASMAKQLIGFPTTPGGPRNPRPKIEPGIFSLEKTGTRASVITLEQDGLFLPGEHKALYEFITNDSSFGFFFSLFGPSTVHNAHTIEPGIYNEIIKKVLNAKIVKSTN
jgi:pimeloyl-ACP methyl ester carboxylesterase